MRKLSHKALCKATTKLLSHSLPTLNHSKPTCYSTYLNTHHFHFTRSHTTKPHHCPTPKPQNTRLTPQKNAQKPLYFFFPGPLPWQKTIHPLTYTSSAKLHTHSPQHVHFSIAKTPQHFSIATAPQHFSIATAPQLWQLPPKPTRTSAKHGSQSHQ